MDNQRELGSHVDEAHEPDDVFTDSVESLWEHVEEVDRTGDFGQFERKERPR